MNEHMPLTDSISIDEIIESALSLCQRLPPQYRHIQTILKECRNRLSKGALHLAVMGMYKRGKSSFLNSLLGLDLLPTSVIPVTSIPTVIKYGEALRLCIRFFNKKPDLVVHESVKAINDCLLEYVAEEHNPLNSRCVEQAIVECPTTFLKNGTIFVDTPGFGSTYTHNTKATLDLLGKCDAVLFLLSPDPPFTLTEVEFLKEVRKAVPRIFFILNKIDLLTIDELAIIKRFIQTILSKNLGFPENTRVFHVSSKMGKSIANSPENNPAWRLSGIEAIRAEIIDFMVREKYFTLSQAIRDKCKEAFTSIQSLLEVEYRELLSPVDSAAKEHASFTQSISSIKNTVDKELGMMDAETKALCDFAAKTIDSLKNDLHSKAHESLRVALEIAHVNKSMISRFVKGAFERNADALFDHFFLQVAAAVNKPLKKAVMLHVDAFIKLFKTVKTLDSSGAGSILEIEKLGDNLEITTDAPWKLEGVEIAFKQMKLPSFGPFLAEQTKRQRYLDCFSIAVTELINLNIIRFSMLINELILASYKKLKKIMAGRAEELLSALEGTAEAKKRILDAAESAAAPRVKEIETQKKAFKEVEKLLV
jgi:hypothetical protein